MSAEIVNWSWMSISMTMDSHGYPAMDIPGAACLS